MKNFDYDSMNLIFIFFICYNSIYFKNVFYEVVIA